MTRADGRMSRTRCSTRSRRWPGYDVADDPALLSRGCGREGAALGPGRELHELGVLAGSAATQEQARLANEHPPVLRTPRPPRQPDRRGRVPPGLARADGHRGRATGCTRRRGRTTRPGAHVARAAKFYVWSQAEAGHGCPVSMTYAAVPALRHAAGAGRAGSSRCSPPAPTTPGCGPPEGKAGLLAGMAMTEKQGGSDVRAEHHPASRCPARRRRSPAHRAQVVLLRADVRPVPGPGPGPGGADLLPAPPGAARRHPQRHAPAAAQGQAGQPVQRLRRRSSTTARSPGRSASRAAAWPTIIEMVSATRLDCVLGSAARDPPRRASRPCTTPATGGRSGPELAAQPLMAAVLADLTLESEAATTLAMRLAGRGRPGRARRRGRGRAAAAGAARGQVLGVQARPGRRRRGAGVPGRQRLRGGVGHAPAVPGRAAQLHLGRLGQRDRPGRAARAGPRRPARPTRCWPSSTSPRAATGGWTPPTARLRRELGDRAAVAGAAAARRRSTGPGGWPG